MVTKEFALEAHELELLLDLIFSHKLDHVRNFLQVRQLPKSGNRGELRERLESALASGRVVPTALVWLLDSIEGFGNQHIYLYQASASLAEQFKSTDKVRSLLTALGVNHFYNHEDPVFLPDVPTLAGVSHDSDYLRVKFVERRTWYEPLEETHERHVEHGTVLVKRYKLYQSRGVTMFRLNLHTGHAELMIQRLPSGTKYAAIRDAYKDRLAGIINFDSLAAVTTAGAILRIEQSGEVERRATNFETPAGSRTSYKSRARGADYNNDEAIRRSREALGTDVAGEQGNFYWLPDNTLARRIHTYVYKDRIAILGECVEQEVDYILSRVRGFAQATS